MNNKLIITFISIFTLALFVLSTAEAKRFGGGFSFGGKKSYSSPYKQKSFQQKSFSQQKAATANQQRKQQLTKRGGLMGMLGGLALGGLLGALFFGGAFEGFNFFDFLMIGGVILLVMWLMNRKKAIPRQQTATAGAYDFGHNTGNSTVNSTADSQPDAPRLNTIHREDAGFTQSFADKFGMNSAGQSHNDQDSATDAQTVILPDWFDQEEFLSGARSAYTMLQEAWDTGDLDSIKDLTTDSVFAEISRQYAHEPTQGNTRVLKLDAQLIDFNEQTDHSEAAVLFDAVLSETDSSGQQGRANQVKELWHFIRPADSTSPTWYLDGIQQLD